MASSASRNTANIYNKERILDFEKIEPARFIWSYGPTAPSPLWPTAPTAALNSLTSKHYSGILGLRPRPPRALQPRPGHSEALPRSVGVLSARTVSSLHTPPPCLFAFALAVLAWVRVHPLIMLHPINVELNLFRFLPSPSAPPSGERSPPARRLWPPAAPRDVGGRSWLE